MTNARLEELRSKFQENPRRYFAPFANELRKAGDPTQAISVCRTHLATQPGHVSGHIVLGQALYEAGEAQEARDVFTVALDLDPENLIALRTLGEISQVKGEFVSARQWYERLLDADPRNVEVAQLLKDLPSENAKSATSEPPVQAHAAETSLEEHREQEQSPYAPPVSPSFHSGFTGPGPAFKTAEDQAEELRQSEGREARNAQPTDQESIDQTVEFVEMEALPVDSGSVESETVVSEQSLVADGVWSPATPTDAPIEMVDFDAFVSEPAVSESASTGMPDESSEPVAASTAHGEFEFAAASPDAMEMEQDQPAADFELPVDDASEEFQQPRALFAERGFDGPAGDQVGWMMTPSAVESDLESAPEDWFDAPVAGQTQEVAAEQPVAEPEPVSTSEADQSTDSWFDEAPGASVVVPTEGLTTDEFWLPPDLSQVATTSVAAAPEPEAVSESLAEMEASETFVAEPVAEFESEVPFAETSAYESFDSAAQEFAPVDPTPVMDAVEVMDSPVMDSPVMDSTPVMDSVPVMDSTPVMESIAPELESFEPSGESGIEYFDHSETVAEVQASAPPAEWSDPFAQAEPEQVEEYVEPVAEQLTEHESSWDQPATATSQVEDAVPVDDAAVVEVSAAVETDAFATANPVPDESGFPAPVVGHSPAIAESTAQSTPEPFVTETLAELYFQQGFRDEALAIYRQLVEREPANVALRQRMEAIEQGETRQSVIAPPSEAGDRSASQSVRTFFSKLARRPAAGPSGPGSHPPYGANQPDVPFASAASALANLFAASKPGASDEGAAASLAGAYTNPTGRPSRAADRELSLDHLFRDVPPGGSQAGGMSMDEFYSPPDAASGSPTEPDEAVESPESGGTDIRQFTAWLEGLRKK
jgi:cytochrome c-type biogenesis protein CcmH/NrfG